MTEITIELFGKAFVFLDIGPEITFNEAISFVIDCEDQEEIDDYWNALTADGGTEVQCGWLKDKFGVSWCPPSSATKIFNHTPDEHLFYNLTGNRRNG